MDEINIAGRVASPGVSLCPWS